MGYKTQRGPDQQARIVRAPIRPLIDTTRTLRLNLRDDGVYMQEVNGQDAAWFRGTVVATSLEQPGCLFAAEPRTTLGCES